MEAVNIRIGPLVFDHADYDADGDVLYLPRPKAVPTVVTGVALSPR